MAFLDRHDPAKKQVILKSQNSERSGNRQINIYFLTSFDIKLGLRVKFASRERENKEFELFGVLLSGFVLCAKVRISPIWFSFSLSSGDWFVNSGLFDTN
jgi:hypothetical protein